MLDGEDKIIESAVRGEASAFGLLYDHYQPKIYRFVMIKVGLREEAEDLTHQVFLSAWQNIKNYRHLGYPFSSWLYQIARNQVIDHYRAKRPTTTLSQMNPEDLGIVSESEAETEMKLTLSRVRAAILTLKPDYQDILIMRFVEELSIKEVAAAIGKSEGAVKLLQHRAVKQLKSALDS